MNDSQKIILAKDTGKIGLCQDVLDIKQQGEWEEVQTQVQSQCDTKIKINPKAY